MKSKARIVCQQDELHRPEFCTFCIPLSIHDKLLFSSVIDFSFLYHTSVELEISMPPAVFFNSNDALRRNGLCAVSDKGVYGLGLDFVKTR